jgi:hypothetical protein
VRLGKEGEFVVMLVEVAGVDTVRMKRTLYITGVMRMFMNAAERGRCMGGCLCVNMYHCHGSNVYYGQTCLLQSYLDSSIQECSVLTTASFSADERCLTIRVYGGLEGS